MDPPETAPYLGTIKSALKQVLAKENTRPLLVGADPSFLPLPNVETESWSEVREADLLHAVAPRETRPIHGREPARGRLSRGGELRRGEGGRERLLRDYRFRGNLALTAALGAVAHQTTAESFSLRVTVPKIAEIRQP
jgi:hypothetical protein